MTKTHSRSSRRWLVSLTTVALLTTPMACSQKDVPQSEVTATSVALRATDVEDMAPNLNQRKGPLTASGISVHPEVLDDLDKGIPTIKLDLAVQDDPVPGEDEIIGRDELSVRVIDGVVVESVLNGVATTREGIAAAADARQQRIGYVMERRTAGRRAKWSELGDKLGLSRELAQAAEDGASSATVELNRADARRLLGSPSQHLLAGVGKHHERKLQADEPILESMANALASMELSTLAFPRGWDGHGVAMYVQEATYPYISGASGDCINTGNLEVLHVPSRFKPQSHQDVCADVRGDSSADRTPIQLWGCNNTAAQDWVWEDDGTISAKGKCLDVIGGGAAPDHTLVQLFTCTGNGAQKWEPVKDSQGNETPFIRNPLSGRCLNVTDNNYNWGTRLEILACNTAQESQKWNFPMRRGAHPTMMTCLAQRGAPLGKIVYGTTGFYPPQVFNHTPPVYVSSHSASGGDSGTYGVGDRNLDIAVKNTRIAHFNCSGNGLGKVVEDALAYNVNTVINYDANVNPPVMSNSRYVDGVNPTIIKPDFAAPGERIMLSPTYPNAGGTSSATPLAAAFALDLMSNDYVQYRGRPALLKAALLTSAERLDTDTHPSNLYGSLVGERDGFGRLVWSNLGRGWAEHAWEGTEAQLFTQDTDSNGLPEILKDVVLGPGRHHAAIAWLVDGSFVFQNRYPDIDLQLYVFDPSGTRIAQSEGEQNWEAVKFDVPTTGTYRFKIEHLRNSAGNSIVLGFSVRDRSVVANNPCDGLCSPPVTKAGPGIQAGYLQTAEVCDQTMAALNGGNCGNMSGRTFEVNGTTMTCNGQNWASLPPKRAGGYCLQASAGGFAYAYYTTW